MKYMKQKFRAWVNGEMWYDGFNISATGEPWIWRDWKSKDTKPLNAPIMQFTGLYDKTDKEIWQGDVVMCHDHPTGFDDVCGTVELLHGNFIISTNLRILSEYGTAWTRVLGNIYENPEMKMMAEK